MQIPCEVPESSVQTPVTVLEGSSVDSSSASGWFLCKYLLKSLALVSLPLRSTIACAGSA